MKTTLASTFELGRASYLPRWGADTIRIAILSVIAAPMPVVAPVAIQQVLDSRLHAFGPVGTPVIVVIAAVVLGLATLGAIGLGTRLSATSEVFLEDLRARVLNDRKIEVSKDVTRRMVDEVDQVSRFVRWGGPALLSNASRAALAVVVLTLYSWELALLAGVASLPFLVRERGSRTRFVREEGMRRRFRSRLRRVFSGGVDRGDRARRQLIAELEAAVALQDLEEVRAARAEASRAAVGEMTTGLAIAIVAVAGTLLGLAGRMTLGQLTAFLLIFSVAIPATQAVVEGLRDWRIATIRWERVTAIASRAG